MTDTTNAIDPAGGSPIECSCCFETFSTIFMHFAYCPARHPFCRTCLRKYADTQLAAQNPDLKCMDMSGCELPFSVSELNAHLTKDQAKLRDRVHLRRDIREANIPNLASCPSCDWAAIIESCKTRYPVAQCWNAEGGCGIVFCRTCERKDHRPRTCEEEERRLAGREVVAEAMTNAVVRICPGCKSQFMKEAGCNLMTCPNCQTKSCYVCRKVVENKYNHFRINQRLLSVPSMSGKCPLFETDEPHVQHAREADAAARQALQHLAYGNRAVVGSGNNFNPTPNTVAGPSRVFAPLAIGPRPHNYAQPPRPHRPLNLNLNLNAALPLPLFQPDPFQNPGYVPVAQYPVANGLAPLGPAPHQGEWSPLIAPFPAVAPVANRRYEQQPRNDKGPIRALPFALVPAAAQVLPSAQPYRAPQPEQPRARQEPAQGGGIHWHHGLRQRAAPYNYNARQAHPNLFYRPAQVLAPAANRVEDLFVPFNNADLFGLQGIDYNANILQGLPPAYVPVNPYPQPPPQPQLQLQPQPQPHLPPQHRYQHQHQPQPQFHVGVPQAHGVFDHGQAAFAGAQMLEWPRPQAPDPAEWYLRAPERATRGAGAM